MKLLNKNLMVAKTSTASAHKRWLVTGFIILLAVLVASPVSAQKKSTRKTKQTVAMSQQVYEALTKIQELVETDEHAAAQAKIMDLQQGKKRLSPYELAQIWNLSGYDYYLQERYDDAIRSYERVLKQPELPEALQQSVLKTLAQLQFTTEDYPTALKTIRRLMEVVPEPAADVYMLLGSAYFQMEQYELAIPPIKKAIELFRAQGKTPRENWLLLLRVAYWELKDYPNMLIVLEELIAAYPKDTYILTLAGVYSELGDTKKQLALTEVLYEKGYIKGKSHATNLENL